MSTKTEPDGGDVPDDVDERALQEWRNRIEESSMSLHPNADAPALARRFGGGKRHVEELSKAAIGEAIKEGANVIQMAHFERGADEVATEPTSRTSPDDSTSTATDEDLMQEIKQAREQEQAQADQEERDVQEDSEPQSESEAPTESDPVEDTPDDVATTDGQEVTAEKPRSELEAEVDELKGRVEELEALHEALIRKLKTQSKFLVGEDALGYAVDPDETDDVLTRLKRLDDRVDEHGQRIQLVRVDGGAGRDTPDSRARLIRQTLYNKAEDSGGTASMDRDDVDSRLDGGNSRDVVLEAMRRAADGHAADINGSSDLEPMDCITFSVGDHGKQSRLVIDLSDATGSEVRRISTTQRGGEEG